MKIIYRISDAGYKKEKPDYINNENCLANAVKVFGNPDDSRDFIVIADNVSEETYLMICKYVNSHQIFKVSVGHGAGTFNLALNKALELDDNEIIYFIENDYIHKLDSQKIMEDTRVYLSDSVHWKITNSTTMTFAAKVSTLKKYEDTLRNFTKETHPNDFQMFLHLREEGGLLLTPLPGYATHGESAWLSPLTDWSTI